MVMWQILFPNRVFCPRERLFVYLIWCGTFFLLLLLLHCLEGSKSTSFTYFEHSLATSNGLQAFAVVFFEDFTSGTKLHIKNFPSASVGTIKIMMNPD